MVGAKNGKQGANGLVPAPGIGDEKLFLRGDGVWAAPEGSGGASVGYTVDGKSIATLDDGITLTLKDFGKKYYKFIAAFENVEAHYVAQVVDANNPWIEGLEPKVVNDNGELILGWFEKDTSLIHKVDTIQGEINTLKSKVKVNQGSIASLQGHVNNIASILNQKANAADVYTKSETDTAISQAVASASHLKRKIFTTFEEAQAFAESISNPDQYIYMVQSEFFVLNDKYDEYLYIDGNLEKVGNWEVDLSDYATKAEIGQIDTKVNNLETLLNTKADKIEVAEVKNNITTVTTKVNNLEALLNNKADKTEVIAIDNKVTNVSQLVSALDTKVGNLENFMNSEYFVSQEQYKTDLDEIREIVTWKEL